MSCSLASSSSKSKLTFYYDVFLTFKASGNFNEGLLVRSLRADAVKIFIDCIYSSAMRASSALEAMERSRIFMVIFTPEFAASNVCLERLERIMEFHRTMNKPVVPVFWGVSQQQVLEQLATPYRDLDRTMVVAEAASLPGFEISNDSDENMSNLTVKLDKYLFRDLPHYPVGLLHRVKEVLHLLKDGTSMIGIWGVGGIGKATCARAIYDRVGDSFESKSFLANVNDEWKKDNGLVHLRKQLISDVFKMELDLIHDVKMRTSQMKEVFYDKSVLVVFDDVNQIDQLIVLCGSSDLHFGKRSLVFITTRNKDLLLDLKFYLYEMKKLDDSGSLELFTWHAFKKFPPTNNFMNLSRKAITFCEGLPLTLGVIGSLLHNRTASEWKIVLKKLKGIPHGQIQEKLKISFDFLTDSEKDLFFNIACFYVGQNKHYVTKMLKGLKVPVEMAMDEIMERGLVEVDMNGKLDVHDLLQEIGRGIYPNKLKLKYLYDVFLSFRGEDTRKSFTTHLYNALKKAGIEVFMDEDRIEKGEVISSSLLQAIESSRISIIIFSKNYAGSSWCLQELEKIMECQKTTYQEVLPIFYDVQPSEVRKQKNTFGNAWERLILRNSASKAKKSTTSWRRALIEAANLSGWDMHNWRTETELIDHIIETITMKLDNNKDLFVAHHPVGLKPRVQDIIKLLTSKSNEIVIVGIWGMGGIGKTTIAKAIYNEIGQTFDGKSFLSNVREVWKQDNGQVYLQEQLLSSILRARRVTLTGIEMGTTLIKEMLCKKRVFLVLDDVNIEDQLKALCGGREWFGEGSRIIITTRDERLLKILRVDNVYNMKEMDDNESLELFSWHAFKQAVPERDFVEFSRRIVSYSGGLPLALEILGSYLFDREMLIWESVLDKLKRIPNDQIHEKLKISYDGLSDHTEKDIFLDICYFFIGKDKSYATQILNGCGFHAEIGIKRLIERSLVKVGKKNKLDMHDLLRDMGREIIREQSLEEPEKRSRLWFHDDVLDVLRNNIGTIAIKGLALNMSTSNSISLSTKAFKNMKRLHLLQLDRVQLMGDFGYLSKELRWLCWHGFPSENLPMNLSLEKIVAIDLKWSNLTKVWKKSQAQMLELKILNLSNSHYLTETPDFSNLPYLEKLILKGCTLLSMIHPSIGDLKYIVLLNLKDCKGLNYLPRSIYNLKSLKTLNLFGCSKIEKLKEDIEQMESLTTLVANQTAITQVPFSLVRLKSIKYVSLCGYEGLSRDVFPSIVLSWMSPTHHSKSLFRAFGIMPSLIEGLSHTLFARSSKILEARPSTSQASCGKTQALIGFHEQVHMERSETFMSSLTVHLGGVNEVMDALLKTISQGWSDGGLPKDNYPDWLVFDNEGSSISFRMPQVVSRLLKGMVFYIIYSSPQDSVASLYPVGIMIKNFTKGTIEFYKHDATTTAEDEEWKKIVANLVPGNEVEVMVNFAQKYIVKKTAIYLVYVEESTKLNITEEY